LSWASGFVAQGVELAQGSGQAGGQAKGQLLGDLAAACLVQLGGVLGQLGGGGQGVLLGLPVYVAAEPPVGEVDLADGLAFKLGVHQGLDLGEGVEPPGDLFSLLAVFQALVDLLADGLRQPCYLASSCHNMPSFLTFIDLH
jgi:hypothetical protein